MGSWAARGVFLNGSAPSGSFYWPLRLVTDLHIETQLVEFDKILLPGAELVPVVVGRSVNWSSFKKILYSANGFVELSLRDSLHVMECKRFVCRRCVCSEICRVSANHFIPKLWNVMGCVGQSSHIQFQHMPTTASIARLGVFSLWYGL